MARFSRDYYAMSVKCRVRGDGLYVLTLLMNLLRGGMKPITASPAPDRITAAHPQRRQGNRKQVNVSNICLVIVTICMF